MKLFRVLIVVMLTFGYPGPAGADGITDNKKACGAGEIGVKKGNSRRCVKAKAPAPEKASRAKCAADEIYVQDGLDKKCVKPSLTEAEANSDKETKKRKKKAKKEKSKKKKQKNNLEAKELSPVENE